MKKTKRKSPPKSKSRNVRRVISLLKKDAGVFLSSEEGKILKKDVVKAALAMGLIAGATDKVFAGHGDGACFHGDVPQSYHGDSITQTLVNPLPTGTGYHSSVHADSTYVPHTDYCNHNDWHVAGGWC